MSTQNPENQLVPNGGTNAYFPGSELLRPVNPPKEVTEITEKFIRVFEDGIRGLKKIGLSNQKASNTSTEISTIGLRTKRGRRLQKNRISRREMLGFMGAATAQLATKALTEKATDLVVDSLFSPKTQKSVPSVSEKDNKPNLPAPRPNPEVVPYSGVSFGNPEMDKAASSVGITLETYSLSSVPENVLVNLNALGEWSNDPNFKPELLPIFAPSILQHRGLIYNLSDEFKINPNLIAAFMSIESGGNLGLVSSAGARGLFQVMPDHFKEDFARLKITDPAAQEKYMQDPVNNGRKGMAFFVNSCLTQAQKLLPDIAKNNPYDVRIISRAMMMYNAGPTGGSYNWNNLTYETQIYSEFGILMAMDAQIAQKLRKDGKSNAEIVRIMSSQENDARSYALNVYLSIFKRTHGRPFEYDDRSQAKEIISKIVPSKSAEDNYKILGIKWKDIIDAYFRYKGKPVFEFPATPGKRQAISTALEYLLTRPGVTEVNMPRNWLDPKTARP